MSVMSELTLKKIFNYASGVSRRRVTEVAVYATDRCNSRCQTCHIWEKQPKHDIAPEAIERLLRDKAIQPETNFMLLGGEFLCHPECDDILSLFKGRNYTLCSNGILVYRLVDTVLKFGIKTLGLSLGGPPDAYRRARGVDTYENVIRAARALKDRCNVTAGFTSSPWNTRQDFIHVQELCQQLGVNFGAAYYCGVEFFGAARTDIPLYPVDNLLRPEQKGTTRSAYLTLYPSWARGELKLPCFSIRFRPVVMPNGDINLCEAKEIKLGNLYQSNFSNIWNQKETRRLQKQYMRCNDCWLDCQRLGDIRLASFLHSLAPGLPWRRFLSCQGWDKLPPFRHMRFEFRPNPNPRKAV